MYKIEDLITALEDNFCSPAYDYLMPSELRGEIFETYEYWADEAIGVYWSDMEEWASDYNGEKYIQQAVEEGLINNISEHDRTELIAFAQYCFCMEQFYSEDKDIRELFVYRYLKEKGYTELSYKQLEKIDEIKNDDYIYTWKELARVTDKKLNVN